MYFLHDCMCGIYVIFVCMCTGQVKIVESCPQVKMISILKEISEINLKQPLDSLLNVYPSGFIVYL